MSSTVDTIRGLAEQDYKWGFITDIDEDRVPKGLSEDIVRLISTRKGEPEFMLEWRLNALRHWFRMAKEEGAPTWANLTIAPIDYQNISYYSAPKKKPQLESLDQVDPEILRTYEKLGIPLNEQKLFSGVAVDAVFDSVSVATTFKGKLAEMGVIFCSFSEAVQKHPDLIKKYLGSVVPHTDNFYAALNAAVFTDGSFVYVPKGVRCPMELSTYFRINAAETGQFERTLIVADEGAYVSYLEGCTAPIRDENQLHAAVVELIALDNAQIKYSTVQNWYPGDKEGRGGISRAPTPARGSSPRASPPAIRPTPTAAWSRPTRRPGARATSPSATALLIGKHCAAHTTPYIEARNGSARMEHEASTSKIGENQLFYLRQRGLTAENAVSMIVNGFCKTVFKELPMEFAVEAQKLLGVSLEGSVG
jgi:Fe-S cluster assembly protein SufB